MQFCASIRRNNTICYGLSVFLCGKGLHLRLCCFCPISSPESHLCKAGPFMFTMLTCNIMCATGRGYAVPSSRCILDDVEALLTARCDCRIRCAGSFPACSSQEPGSQWGGGGSGWAGDTHGSTQLPNGSDFAQQAFYQQLMVRTVLSPGKNSLRPRLCKPMTC